MNDTRLVVYNDNSLYEHPARMAVVRVLTFSHRANWATAPYIFFMQFFCDIIIYDHSSFVAFFYFVLSFTSPRRVFFCSSTYCRL